MYDLISFLIILGICPGNKDKSLLAYQPGELGEWGCRNPDNIRRPGLIGP